MHPPPGTTARAVVLAGGKGTRLEPYTTVLPKPLLPVGGRAILDVVVRQLRRHGFTELTFAVGYLGHLIQAVFAGGEDHGVRIRYHVESEPLGTAGALATIEGLDEPFLMMNGDVLTTLDFADLYRSHRSSGNAMTIAAHRRIVKPDYGILHVEGEGREARVAGYEEKPELPYVVSMGVYVMDPSVLRHVTPGERLDLPELVLELLAAGEPVGSYLYDGYWLDIGRHEDYERANAEAEAVLPDLLGEAGSDPPAPPGPG